MIRACALACARVGDGVDEIVMPIADVGARAGMGCGVVFKLGTF